MRQRECATSPRANARWDPPWKGSRKRIRGAGTPALSLRKRVVGWLDKTAHAHGGYHPGSRRADETHTSPERAGREDAMADHGSQGQPPGEEAESFFASRWTRGNFLFPTEISVSPIRVLKRKRSWFSSDDESIHIHHVSSVRIRTGLMFSEIWIESSGGTNQIQSHGHWKSDAQEIKRLIEEHQRLSRGDGVGGKEAAPSGRTRPCPWCAEPIRVEAKICRYCNRDVTT